VIKTQTLRKRTLPSLTFLLAGFGGFAQCAPAPAPTLAPVVIVGDSITVDNRDEYQASIPGVVVDGIWGRGWDSNAGGQTFPTFRQAMAANIAKVAPGGSLVIHDDGGEGATTAEHVKYVTDLLPDDRRLVWVSPSNNNVPWTADSQQTILDGIQEQPDHVYVDWHSEATPDRLTDGLHLNQAGQSTLNHLVYWATR
jgi:hypothetical protein